MVYNVVILVAMGKGDFRDVDDLKGKVLLWDNLQIGASAPSINSFHSSSQPPLQLE